MTKTLTTIAGFADVNAAAMPDVEGLILTEAAVGQFARLIGRLYEPGFDEHGKPILNAKKKQVYLEVAPQDIAELRFTRSGKGRLGHCAGWNVDYVRRTP